MDAGREGIGIDTCKVHLIISLNKPNKLKLENNINSPSQCIMKKYDTILKEICKSENAPAAGDDDGG